MRTERRADAGAAETLDGEAGKRVARKFDPGCSPRPDRAEASRKYKLSRK